MNRSNSHTTFLVLVFLLLVGLAASCVMPVPATPAPGLTPPPRATEVTPPPSDDPDKLAAFCREYGNGGQAQQAATPTPDPSQQAAGIEVPPLVVPPFEGLIYVDGQVLLTGQPEAATQVSNTFNLKLSFDDREVIQLADGRTIQLATIEDERSVEEVTCLFNRFALANPDLDVAADPNYFLSPASWRGGGSPWTQNGRWARNLPGGGLGLAGDSTDFTQQWAFGKEGIDLMLNNSQRATRQLGGKAQIVILDTSPVAAGDLNLESEMGNPMRSPGIGSPAMTIWDIPVVDHETCPGKDRYTGEPIIQDISSHGLFVASLAHAVAPQSKIHLMRVLEKDGCGDLMTILRGMETTSRDLSNRDAPFEESLKGTVVNLSLGVHRPENACGEDKPECTYGLPLEVTALQAMVQQLSDQGAVVVAAAGNDSWDVATPAQSPKEAEIPASEPSALSVVGSTFEQTRGCYSNQGVVAAPGGNGVDLTAITGSSLALEAGDAAKCVVPGLLDSGNQYWCEAGNEEYCLIGFGYGPDAKTGEDGFRYIYWVGTSFAAPLVSGAAALMLDGGMSPAEVRSTLPAGVNPPAGPDEYLGSGIIDIASLAP